MGGYFTTKTAVWTFWFLLCSVKTVISADLEFLEDLGVDTLLDVTKINVSQDEYTRMMTIYLERLQDTQELNTIPKLLTFNSERKSWRRRRDGEVRVRFPVRSSSEDLEVQSAELRLLAPPIIMKNAITVKVYQVLSPRRRRFIDERLVYLSEQGPKWCEFDVTSAVQAWTSGQRNLGLVVECEDCGNEVLRPVQAALTALVLPENQRRKRSVHGFEEGGRTDCANVNNINSNKPRCCRHEMMVTFKTLKINSIIQPKQYEAGFCKGRCPLNFNHATNHSRIQNLVHKLDKNATPRACCAPSKLEPLEILRVDPNDATKLSVEKWDNMKVLECACS